MMNLGLGLNLGSIRMMMASGVMYLDVTGVAYDTNGDLIMVPVRMFYAGDYLGKPYFTLDGEPVEHPEYGLNGGCISIQDEWILTLVPDAGPGGVGSPGYLTGRGSGVIEDISGIYEPYGLPIQSGEVTALLKGSGTPQSPDTSLPDGCFILGGSPFTLHGNYLVLTNSYYA